MFFGRNLPQFLDPKAEYLGPPSVAQTEHLGQPLGQMPSRALGEEGVFRVQLDAGLVVRTMATVPSDAEIARRNAFDRPVLVEQDLGRREAGENLNPELLGLARQPS